MDAKKNYTILSSITYEMLMSFPILHSSTHNFAQYATGCYEYHGFYVIKNFVLFINMIKCFIKSYSMIFSIKVCLHFPTSSPSTSQCPSKFNIMSIVTAILTDRMGDRSILPVKMPVTICTMLNFDGDGDSVGTCKQTFKPNVLLDNVKPKKWWYEQII